MIILTEKQKNELKNILEEKEYQELIEIEEGVFDFLVELHLLIDGYMDEDYNDTKESEKLQAIYDEIYNQNLN